MFNHTVIDRVDLAYLFSDLKHNIGAEIGVSKGKFSEVLLKANPHLKLYCIDSWSPYDECPSQEKQDRCFEETKKRLKNYNVVFIRKNSMDALNDIPDSSLDFVYIDANHTFESVSEDIAGWTTKVKGGGIVSGHDYFHHPTRPIGVILAIDNFIKENKLQLCTTNEKYPSWYFVKQ